MKQEKHLVIGAGFSGAVIARELAEAGHSVYVMDTREHIGGNAYDYYDAHGFLVHKYGPHIFHTNSEKVQKWLSQFTEWRPYEHKVLAKVEDKLVPIPINRTTINELYGLNLKTDEDVELYLDEVRAVDRPVKNSEDVVLNSVGHDLCEKFFRGYTKKQWDMDLSELAAGVAARIPTRTNTDDRYFTDMFQAMPLNGYTVMFEKIFDHENIMVVLGVQFKRDKSIEDEYDHVWFTGPIDEYYHYLFGPLPYRSLNFVHTHCNDYNLVGANQAMQRTGTVNYPNDYDYTRISEFKFMTGQMDKPGSSLVTEYPTWDGDPYYPVRNETNDALASMYRDHAKNDKHVTFVGRLAQYQYYNMDQAVASALSKVRKYLGFHVDDVA